MGTIPALQLQAHFKDKFRHFALAADPNFECLAPVVILLSTDAFSYVFDRKLVVMENF